MFQKLLILITSSIFILSCVPEKIEYSDSITIDLGKEDFRKIFNHKDALLVDSLYPFMQHSDPSLRYLAAMSIASLRDSSTIDSLAALLYDDNIEVRAAAAYAIGQTQSRTAIPHLLEAFRSRDTADVVNKANANILEAIGKVGDLEMLNHLASVKSYRNTDTLMLRGQARGIYRFAFRGIHSEAGTRRMVDLIDDIRIDPTVRLIAGHYLHRTNGIDVAPYKLTLIDKFTSERDPNLKMVLATALAKTADLEALPYLLNQLKVEQDHRVKINIIRSLRYFPYIQVVDVVIKELKNDDVRVAKAAALYLTQNGHPNDVIVYRELLKDTLNRGVQAQLYKAILTQLPFYYKNTRFAIRQEIKTIIDSLDNSYIKADFISCLGKDPDAYKLIDGIRNEDQRPIVQSTAAAAMSDILTDDKFILAHRSSARRVKKEMADMLIETIAAGDVGAIAAASAALASEKAGLAEVIDSLDKLENSRLSLNLPKDIEAYRELSKAIAFLKGREYTEAPPAFNHPIDWNVLNTINDSSVVVVKTNKGNFSFSLLTETAPGSVLNFVELASNDFYDNNIIHRVVDNFVMQAGCSRGDGYGSLNYSIRSDLSQMYYDDEGYVGMASAGINTECTQWFVTHSPTPHLDGNYTIFGKIVGGMDVVQQIEVGDQIRDIIITKF